MDPVSTPEAGGKRGWIEAHRGLFAVVLLVAACLTPWSAFFLTHHPDERHYTDAALEMLRRGDFFTPYSADGSLRLNKPIVPYWLTLASYLALGISPWSSRLPFLLCGLGLVWLTHTLALRVLRDARWALLAALIVACHPSLIISAPRSVPDSPLALFLLMGANGFVWLIVERRSNWTALALAYGGTALAVLTKGLPGAVFGGYAVAMLWWLPEVKRHQQWKRHGIAALLGMTLATSWYLAMYALHGDAFLGMFYRDQIGVRVARTYGQCALQFIQNLLMIGATLLVWVIPLFVAGPGWRQAVRRWRAAPETIFLGGWVLLWISLASFVDRANLRYLLPILPWMAVLLALSWRDSVEAGLRRAMEPLWWAAVGVLTIATLAVAVALGIHGHPGLGLATVAAVAALTAALARARKGSDIPGLAATGVATCLVLVAVAAAGMMPWTLPDTGARIADQLRQLSGSEKRTPRVVYVGEPAIAARIRVFLGGSIPLEQHSRPRLADLAQAEVLVAPRSLVLGPEWVPVETLAHGYDKFVLADFLRAALAGDLKTHLAAHRCQTTIAVRHRAREQTLARTASWNDAP